MFSFRNKCLSLNEENIIQRLLLFSNYDYIQSRSAKHINWKDKKKNIIKTNP